MFSMTPSFKIAQMISLNPTEEPPEPQIMNLLNNISWTTGQNSKLFYRIVPHNTLHPLPKLHKCFRSTEQKGYQSSR